MEIDRKFLYELIRRSEHAEDVLRMCGEIRFLAALQAAFDLATEQEQKEEING